MYYLSGGYYSCPVSAHCWLYGLSGGASLILSKAGCTDSSHQLSTCKDGNKHTLMAVLKSSAQQWLAIAVNQLTVHCFDYSH